jgi:glyoxylate utilization-related uncharacterized protein
MAVNVQNRNRAHAVQQLKKALKSIDKSDDLDTPELQLWASLANAFVYIGDSLEKIADSFDTSELHIDNHVEIVAEEGAD